MNRKKNSIRILAAGMEQFEAKQQQADFSTLETFLAAYLNTPVGKLFYVQHFIIFAKRK